jgi:hypothetical protein
LTTIVDDERRLRADTEATAVAEYKRKSSREGGEEEGRVCRETRVE